MSIWTDGAEARLIETTRDLIEQYEDMVVVPDELTGAIEVAIAYTNHNGHFPEHWLPSPHAIEYLWDYWLSGAEFVESLQAEHPLLATELAMLIGPVKVMLDKITN